jgi:dynein heavy chain
MEKSDLEAERVALFESVMQNQRSMKELESNLLCRLTSTQVCTKHFNDQSLNLTLSLHYKTS